MGPRLDKALARAVPAELALSRTRLGALIRGGNLCLEATGEALSDPSMALRGSLTVALTIPAVSEIDLKPQRMSLDIVFEDDAILVVNKSRGLVVHPGAGVSSGTLVNGLLAHCAGSLSGIGGEARPGIVHRIDRDTSGLLVVAKTDRAHQALSAQFAQHSVHRRYQALIWGVPDPAMPRLGGHPVVSQESGGTLVLTAPLARHPADRKKMSVAGAGGKRAVTRAQVRQVYGTRASEMWLWLETGRTHQIRVHMSHIGFPLIGDAVYGRSRTVPDSVALATRKVIAEFDGQALHAAELGFVHPVTAEHMTWSVPPPPEYAALQQALCVAFGEPDD